MDLGDLASIKSQGQVLEVFDNLFHKYSNLTELPKFKKRRLSQVGNSNSKVCENQQKSSNLPQSHQSSLKTLRSAEHLEEEAGDASLLHHAKDLGSFSSGVFSIDSDIDNLNDEDENHVEEQVDSRIDSVGHEKNCLSSEALSEASSEAGSGIVEMAVSFSEERQDLKDVLQEGYGKLTDEDVLFMMHKPRLRKRRKKPRWQRRKLDLDNLWVKGQHLQNYHGSDLEEAASTKLWLERNLRWGKISLQNYVCAMRKSRKGRKRLNNSSRNRSAGQTQSVKDTLSENKYSVTVTSNAKLKIKKAKNELPVGIPQKRSSFENAGKEQTVSKVRNKAQQSTQRIEDVSDKTSDTFEQDYKPRSEPGISSHAFPKAKCGSDAAVSAKEGKGKTTGKSQRSSSKAEGSRADMFDSKAKCRLKKTEGAKNLTLSGGKRGSLISGGNSSTSRGNSAWNVTDGDIEDSEDTMTQNGHCHRPRQSSRTSSGRTKRDSNIKSSSALTPAGSNSWHYYDLQQENESQETVINLISLTPRKSRKLSRRKRHAEEKRDTNPMSTSDSSDFDGHVRSVSLHPRGSLLTSNSPELEDEEEVECQPLFGHGKHCGGVWNTIIEESS